MKKRVPPSSAPSPLSRELVEAVIRKKSAPSGPAPLGFKPKDLSQIMSKQKYNPHDQRRNGSEDSSKEDSENDSSPRSSSGSDSESSPTEESISRKGKKQIKATTTPQMKKLSMKNDNELIHSRPYERNSNNNNRLPNTVFKFTKEVSLPKQPVNFDFITFLRGAKNRKLKQFLLSPCARDTTIRCYIERDRFGSNLLSPVYTLCADLADGSGQELMVCKKVLLSRTPHYVFSIMSTDLYKSREQRSNLYLGKLRSTVPGSYKLLTEEVPVLSDIETEDTAKLSFSLTASTLTSTNSSAAEDNDRTFHSQTMIKGQSPVQDDLTTSSSFNEVPTRTRGKEDNDVDAEVIKTSADSGTGQEKIEAASIVFHTTTRPAPDGIRGCEICVPHPDIYGNAKNAGFLDTVPPAMKNLDDLFTKVRAAGKQNELYAEECVVLHERKTK